MSNYYTEGYNIHNTLWLQCKCILKNLLKCLNCMYQIKKELIKILYHQVNKAHTVLEILKYLNALNI